MNTHPLFSARLILLTCASLLLVSCNTMTVRGSGPSYEVRHDITTITEIEVNGIGELRLQNGSANQVVVTAQEQVHDYLRVNQEGHRLVIEPKDGYRFKTDDELSFLIIANGIEFIDVSGAVNITSGDYQTDRLTIQTSGASDIDMTVMANQLTVDASGSLDSYFSGQVQSFIADFSGASDLNAYDLEAEDVDLKVSGAGTAYLTARHSLTVSTAGAITVFYQGNPVISQSTAGASSINHTPE